MGRSFDEHHIIQKLFIILTSLISSIFVLTVCHHITFGIRMGPGR